jgi:ATP-dependent DNA ligase
MNVSPVKPRKPRRSVGRGRLKPATQQPEGEWVARKRELIDTGTDKRYVRRNKLGTSFVESDDVGRSLAADRRKRAKTKVESGEGDKGDGPRAQKPSAKPLRKSRLAGAPLGNLPARKPRARNSTTLPDFIPFATCLLVHHPPNGPDWALETKLDGWRIQIPVEDGAATLRRLLRR